MFQDEDVYTFFEPDLPTEVPAAVARTTVTNPFGGVPVPKIPNTVVSPSRSARLKKQRSLSILERKANSHGSAVFWRPVVQDRLSLHEGSSVLDLKGDNYFSCAVGRKRSNARYLIGSSDDVVTLVKELSECSECQIWVLDEQICGFLESIIGWILHGVKFSVF